MPLPTLKEQDILDNFPQLDEISAPLRGGQKLVFPCRIGSNRFVLKVMLSDLDISETGDEESDTPPTDEVFERAKREVAILEGCTCNNLPKVGPIPLRRFKYKEQSLIAFSEEYISGRNLNEILHDVNRFDDETTIQLGEDLNSAVEALWRMGKIHRDIKPPNIMRRGGDGPFVLLDPGIAFDINDEALTVTGGICHTKGYLAPELSNPDRKREADCRSDFFLIGTVLYLASTGRHPFMTNPTLDRSAVIRNIVNLTPPNPHDLCSDITPALSGLIMRLLAKRKHGRFKNSELLQFALTECRRSS